MCFIKRRSQNRQGTENDCVATRSEEVTEERNFHVFLLYHQRLVPEKVAFLNRAGVRRVSLMAFVRDPPKMASGETD